MLELDDEDQKQIEQSIAAIRKVLRKHDSDISSIVGFVTKHEIEKTEKAVSVRFAEESVLNVQMNMVAFD